MDSDNSIKLGKKQLPNYINRYVSEIGPTLAKNHLQNNPVYNKILHERINEMKGKNLLMADITPDEIAKQINLINVNKSSAIINMKSVSFFPSFLAFFLSFFLSSFLHILLPLTARVFGNICVKQTSGQINDGLNLRARTNIIHIMMWAPAGWVTTVTPGKIPERSHLGALLWLWMSRYLARTTGPACSFVIRNVLYI